MKILYIWDADYPWDIRVEKICDTLKSNGHEIHIASRNLKRKAVYEEARGISIHRIDTWKNDKLNYFFSFPLFFSPVWKRFLDRIIKKNNIEIIIVRDLPMAIAGIWAGKRANIPVIFDMAEDYVAMIRDIWKLRKYQGLNLLIRNPYFAKYVEQYSFRHADKIIVVVEEAINVVTKGGGDLNKITVVSNTPNLSDFENLECLHNTDTALIKNHFSVIYTGGIQMGRGLQTVLAAIPKIIIDIPDFLFVIIGDGYASGRIKEMIKTQGLDKYVLWVGWVDHTDLFGYVKCCNVGIIPHFVTEHVKTTIPNKIFDYMGCGIPVISSDAAPMKQLLENEQCGITFRSGDADDMAKAIKTIHDSRFDYGNNGKNAVRKRYNWHEDEKKLIRVISNCV